MGVCACYFSVLMRRMFGDNGTGWRVHISLGHTEDPGSKGTGRIKFQNVKLLLLLFLKLWMSNATYK